MKIASVRAHSLTAGLSPNNNERTEVFFAGCKKALENPCPGCFNQDLWTQEGYPEVTAEELFSDIEKEKNYFVTIVGGEPLDQYEGLLSILELLNKEHYHIVLITHYTLKEIAKRFSGILGRVNVIIDGVYDPTQRIYDTDKRKGIYHVVGSRNQKIWHLSNKVLFNSYEEVKNEADLIYAYLF